MLWVVWNDAGQVWAYLSADSTVAVRGFLAVPRAQVSLYAAPAPANLVSVWDDGSADTALPTNIMSAINQPSQTMTAAVTMFRPEDALFASERELASTTTPFPVTGTPQFYGLGYANPGDPPAGLVVDPYSGYPIQSDYSLELEQAVLFNLSGLDPITSQPVSPWTAIPYGASPLIILVNRGDPASLGYVPSGSNYGITNLTLYDNTVTQTVSSSGCATCLPSGYSLPAPQRYPAAWLFSGNECDTGVFPSGPPAPSEATTPVNPLLADPLSGAWNMAEYGMFDTANFPDGVMTIFPVGIQTNGTYNPVGLTQENYVAARIYGASRNNPLNKDCFNIISGTKAGQQTAATANRGRVIGMSDTIVGLTNTDRSGIGNNATLPVEDEIGYVLFSYELVAGIANSVNTAAPNLPLYGYLSIRWVDSDGTQHDVDPLYSTYSGKLPTCSTAGSTTAVTCAAPSANGIYDSFPNLRNGTYPLWNIYRLVTDASSASVNYTNSLVWMREAEALADTTLPDIVPFDPQCASTQDGTNDEPGLAVYRQHYVAPYNPAIAVTANDGPQQAPVGCSSLERGSYSLPHLALGGTSSSGAESGSDLGGLILSGVQIAAATPSVSPVPGFYTTTQSVTLSDATAGATIYYTLDGSTPTTSSAVYAGPIAISATTTIQAIAAATGYLTSSVASDTFTIGLPPATAPTFSPPTATSFYTTLSVTLSDATSGATIYYTLDGSTPTTSSTLYTGPITISTSTTVEAIAIANGYSASDVATARYTPQAATPTFAPPPGTYNTTQSVTLSDTTPNVFIYYTLDGSAPNGQSTPYTGPITVSTTTTINAIATGGSGGGYSKSATAVGLYTINQTAVQQPTFSPAAGTYTTPQSVTLSDATSGAAIYYTLDGSIPTTSSALYSGAITVSTTTTIKAIAAANGYITSGVVSGTFTITPPAATPTFSPAAGSYTTPQSVTLSDATPGAAIYYTLDGSAPTTSSTLYAGAITVSATTTIKAIAIASGYSQSGIASATFVVTPTAAIPTFSPAAGTYNTPQSVILSDTTSGAAIYYALDGSTPTTSSTLYAGAITVSTTATIKAIAIANGYGQSGIASATFTITPPAATPTFSPAAGTYTTPQSVILSDATSGAAIYYTLDGSTPTASSRSTRGQSPSARPPP